MSNSRFMVMLLLALALAAFAAQFAIDFSSENIAAACIVLASAMTILLYINWSNAIQTHPLSTFAIFGFCMTTQMGALLGQSAAWTSLTLNLRQPLETFATLACYQGIAVIAHSVYRIFSSPNLPNPPSLIRIGLQRLGLYATPTSGTLWIMGVVGLLNFLLSGGVGIGSKVSQGMTFVAWAPFLIPMYVLQQGSDYCNVRKNYVFLALHVSVIAFLGVAANARGLMLSGLVTIALFTLLTAMRSGLTVKMASLTRFAALLTVLGVVWVPVNDFMTAMVLARGVRANASPLKMVDETMYYFQQPQLLRAEQTRTKFIGIQGNYDETYFSSSLLGRLVETKFHDNALYFGSRLSVNDREKLWDVTGDFFWTTLPEPMLNAMKINVDKNRMLFTMGDYLSHLAGAGNLGGYKTGSGFAQGIAMFDYAFPVIYFFVCMILFITLDILSFRSVQGTMCVSALGMLGIWRMFQYGISAESLHVLFIGVVRGLPQTIILYLVIFHIARMGARMLANHSSISQSTIALAK